MVTLEVSYFHHGNNTDKYKVVSVEVAKEIGYYIGGTWSKAIKDMEWQEEGDEWVIRHDGMSLRIYTPKPGKEFSSLEQYIKWKNR